jgi:phosphoglycolate phosphatase-like HAD superfamily hydrolase
MAPTLSHAHFVRTDLARPDISHAIFDFDGTLSWLRHGWPALMLKTFLNHAPAHWCNDAALCSELLADILSLNGKPSIHQLARCCERAKAAGVDAPEPQALLEEYLPLMREIVDQRVAAIRSGARSADDFVVWNARRALQNLRGRDVTLIILSGTVEPDVRAEAEVLGLAPFFGNHIYGSPVRGSFSKKDVIDRILREERIEGHHLLSFGDGPVEIQSTKAVGGLAIGVASDEEINGSHTADVAKAKQLLVAGADVIVPDYAEVDALLGMIFSA